MLEPCCRIHHVARGERIRAAADDGLTCLHADPEGEIDAEARPQRIGQTEKRMMHFQRATNRALGVVLVHGRYTEDGHHRVARELLYRAAELLDDCPHASEIGVLDALNRFWIKALPKRRRPDEVAEEDGYGLTLARDTHEGKRSTCAPRTLDQAIPAAADSPRSSRVENVGRRGHRRDVGRAFRSDHARNGPIVGNRSSPSSR